MIRPYIGYAYQPASFAIIFRAKCARTCGGKDLADIRDKVDALKKAGRTLPETVAAKPTADHDAKWGQFVIDPAFFTKLVYEGA